jgi:tetratricopeptide (TPR) repeat protein
LVLCVPFLLTNTAMVLLLPAMVEKTDSGARTFPWRGGQDAATRTSERLLRLALAWQPQYGAARRGLGRVLEQQGRWEEAAEAYAALGQGTDDPVSARRRATILDRMGRPDLAFSILETSGYWNTLLALRAKAETAPSDARFREASDLLADLAVYRLAAGDNRGAATAGEQALELTDLPGAISAVAHTISDAHLRSGDAGLALAYLWLSLSAEPGSVDDGRYDDVCRLVVSQLTSQARDLRLSSDRDTLYLLRCYQRLGQHAAVVRVGEEWEDQARRGALEGPSIRHVRCLAAESRRAMDGSVGSGADSAEAGLIRECVMPFTGPMSGPADVADSLMPTYALTSRVCQGSALVSARVNALDLELGLPPAVHLYWTNSQPVAKPDDGTDDLTVTYARVKNLAPNAGFEFHGLGPSLPSAVERTGILGYARDIYAAPESTRALGARGSDGPFGAALLLENREGVLSSGLSSYPVPVRPGSTYLQGGYVRSADGGLLLGRRWITAPPREDYGYVEGVQVQSDWRPAAAVLKPPTDATGVETWLLNFRSRGIAAFDQVVFLELPDTMITGEGCRQ